MRLGISGFTLLTWVISSLAIVMVDQFIIPALGKILHVRQHASRDFNGDCLILFHRVLTYK